MASRDRQAEAEECKAKGNDALKAQDFDKAIEWYSEAIKLHKDHVYFSNRSAAYLSKGFAETALKDAEECIKLQPAWAKGFSRKGAALHKMNKLDAAITAFEDGLKLEPENAGLLSGLEAATQARDFPGGAGGFGGAGDANPLGSLFGPDFMDRVRASPKLSKYLEDPAFEQMLTMLQSNPNMLQMAMQDPRIQDVLSEILGIQFRAPEEDAEDRARRERENKEHARQTQESKAAAEKKKAEEAERLRREAETPEEREKRENKERAEIVKQEGNELYKQRDFAAALAKYAEARELDPENMMLLLNIASVKLEQADLDGCLESCDEAIKVGRSVYAPYDSIAKAYERKGNAYAKHAKWAQALEEYKKAQLEAAAPAVANKMRVVEQKLKAEAASAYVDPALAEEAKERGNAKFKAGEFPAAVEEYSEAVKRDPTNAVYYGNRASAFMKLMDFGRAMEDCNKALELKPDYVKVMAKRGNIQVFLKEYHKALKSYQQGLDMDPTNQECRDGLQRTRYAIQSSSSSTDNERASRALEDPEIRAIMSDPVMRTVLEDMSTNPDAARKHMSNPGIAQKIETLIAAGVLKTG